MRRDDVAAIAALDDPQRQRLYEYVRDSGRAVTREEAAAAAGISRKLAAFHLDRLVEAGWLLPSFDRAAGESRRIGRAPKRYALGVRDVSVTIPERRYDLAGEILVEAVTKMEDGAGPVEAVNRVARARGQSVGAQIRAERRLGRLGPERAMTLIAELLEATGFAPKLDRDSLVERNCPFYLLAQQSPRLICDMNRHFVEGLLSGLEAARVRAELDPGSGRCCVVLRTE